MLLSQSQRSGVSYPSFMTFISENTWPLSWNIRIILSSRCGFFHILMSGETSTWNLRRSRFTVVQEDRVRGGGSVCLNRTPTSSKTRRPFVQTYVRLCRNRVLMSLTVKTRTNEKTGKTALMSRVDVPLMTCVSIVLFMSQDVCECVSFRVTQ